MNSAIPRLMCRLAVIAAAALLIGCETISRMDSKLYDVTSAISEPDAITGLPTLSLADREQEIASGNRYAEGLIGQLRGQGLPLNEAVDRTGYRRLQRIFARVHGVSHLKDERWEVVLIPDDSFNAFVTGGTYVFVHAGLLHEVRSDDEIAAVLGHELAHVAASHIAERDVYSKASLLLARKDGYRSSYQASYATNQEAEADRIGVLYAALAGYHPMAASSLWSRLYAKSGDYIALEASHPMNSERMASTREHAALVMGYYRSGRMHPEAARILRGNPLAVQVPAGEQMAPGRGLGLFNALSILGNAYLQHEQAKREEAARRARLGYSGY